MYIYNIMATTNGDLFLVGTDAIYQGYTDEGVSDYSRHGYIARMSKDGELVWDALIGDDLEFFDCEEVSDGIFLVLGRDIKNQDKNGIVLFAFGEDGTLLWKKAIESETDDSAFSMVQDGNGHLYLAGVSDTDEGYDGLFMKLDTEGDLIWKRAYDDGRHEMFTKIALSEDGDLVLLGTNKWLEFLPNSIPLYSEALVVSFDTDGNLRWAVSQGSGSDYTVPNDIDIGPDGIIAITGRVSIYREKEDILSLLIDMEGNILD
jgi:outer membrane protein assembly factor BamB